MKKCFFSGFDTILHICSDCDENTFESSAKKSPVGSPNWIVRFRVKDSNEMTFFRTFHIQIFSQTLSGKYPAVVWKPIFTRADEPMKKEVSIRSSSIPKKVLGIWRRSFGFRLKHFCMAGNTAFYAFKERIEEELFRNNFCFWMVTEHWVKPYLNFGRTFPRGCQWCNLRIQGNISRWKYFFQNSKQIFFSELGQKSLSFPYQSVPGTTIKNGLFSCRLTHSMKWFSWENIRFRRFNWILRGKTPAELSKKAYFARKTIEESGFLLRLIWFLKLLCHIEQFFFGF